MCSRLPTIPRRPLNFKSGSICRVTRPPPVARPLSVNRLRQNRGRDRPAPGFSTFSPFLTLSQCFFCFVRNALFSLRHDILFKPCHFPLFSLCQHALFRTAIWLCVLSVHFRAAPPTFQIRVAELSPIFSPNSSLSPNYLFHNQVLSTENGACRRFHPNSLAFTPVSC